MVLVPRVAFTTLGCKVNQYETQRIQESFLNAGFEVVEFTQSADVYVINSCSVTSEAERKSRYTIRRARRLNEDAKVVVTGCAAQMSLNKAEPMEGADLVVANTEKLQTLEHLHHAWPEMVPANAPPGRKLTKDRTRATLKVQDGCDVHCSYCSIPFTRPGMVSRPENEVIEEAKVLAEQGVQEVVLTGVLIGAYQPCFETLVERVARETGIARVRISSIELHHVTHQLVKLIEKGWVVPHLHIPLQAGNSQVLKDMNRRYDQSAYLKLCQWLKDEIPEISLTTDVLVGFPTESEDRFQSTIEVFESVKFLAAHVFSFSPRWGTPADAWGDPVESKEKDRRREVLNAIAERTRQEHLDRFVGRNMRVLFEGKISPNGEISGLTDNYLPVTMKSSGGDARTLQTVRLVGRSGSKLIAEPVLRVMN